MTPISPNVLCQCSFFYLPRYASTRFQSPRLAVRQALSPATQKFLPHPPQFFNGPSFGVVCSLQISSRIVDQVEHPFHSGLYRGVTLQAQTQLFFP